MIIKKKEKLKEILKNFKQYSKDKILWKWKGKSPQNILNTLVNEVLKIKMV